MTLCIARCWAASVSSGLILFMVLLLAPAPCVAWQSVATPEPAEPQPGGVAADGATSAIADSEEVEAAVRRAAEAYAQALVDQNLKDFREIISSGAMADEVLSDDRHGLNIIQQLALRSGIYFALARIVNAGDWAAYRVGEISIAPGTEHPRATAMVRSWDELGESTRWRLSLQKKNGRWIVYDVVDIYFGWGMVDAIRAGLSDNDVTPDRPLFEQLTEGGAERERTALRLLAKARVALGSQEWYEIYDVRNQLQDAPITDFPAALYWMTMASLSTALAEFEPALEACAKAEAAGADHPLLPYLQAVAFNQLEKYTEAVACAQRFLDKVGPDASGYYELGVALEALGRIDEAREAFAQGLDDTPDLIENLVQWAVLLPQEQKSQIADRMLRMRNPQARFEELASALMSHRDAAALEAAVAGLKRVAPDDPNAVYYLAEAYVLRGDLNAAAAELEAILPRVEHIPDGEAYVSRYLEVMADNGQAVTAYEKVGDKPEYFENFIDHLIGAEQWPVIEQILAIRARKVPGDHLPDYYRAEALLHQREFLEAKRFYDKVARRSGLDVELYDWCRYRRVECYLALNQAPQAYQELAIGADESTRAAVYEQLVTALVAEGNANDLTEVVRLLAENGGTAVEVALGRAQIAWMQKDFRATAQLMLEHGERLYDELEERRHEWEDMLIRSLLRTKQYDDALKFAQRATAEDGDRYYEALVLIARKDHAALPAVLRSLAPYYETESLLADEDAAPHMQDEALRKLLDEAFAAGQADRLE